LNYKNKIKQQQTNYVIIYLGAAAAAADVDVKNV